jgi:uncharacterized membrane protein YfhO
MSGRRALGLADSGVLLALVWYPGWRAWVDGQPAPVLRAYTTLRAVPMPAGAHVVILRYEPLSVRLGLALSGMAFALLCLSAFHGRP